MPHFADSHPLVFLYQLVLQVVVHLQETVYIFFEFAVLLDDLLHTFCIVLVVLDHGRLRVTIGIREGTCASVLLLLLRFLCDCELCCLVVVRVPLGKTIRLSANTSVCVRVRLRDFLCKNRVVMLVILQLCL